MEKEELLQKYKEEKDPNVKDKLMLVITLRFDDSNISWATGA